MVGRRYGILALLLALLVYGSGTTLAANDRLVIARAVGQTTVLAWGHNGEGQLGTGSAPTGGCFCDPSSQAISLPGLQAGETVTALASGDYHSLALTSRSRVFTWGLNNFGQLGTGSSDGIYSYIPHPTPQAISLPGLQGGEVVTALAAGIKYSLALTSRGRIFSWGSNYFDDLGTGSGSTGGCFCDPSPQAVALPGLQGGEVVTTLAASGYHSLTLTSQGRVFVWGSNYYGELGTGSVSASGCRCVPTPQAISLPGLQGGETVSALAAGAGYSLALTSQGRVFAWGSNAYGQLGTGSSDVVGAHPTPQAITLPGLQPGETVTALAAGAAHSLALTSRGRVFAWGDNYWGQLGTGSATTEVCFCDPAPQAISLAGLPTGQTVTGIFTGSDAFHSFALAAPPAGPLVVDGARIKAHMGQALQDVVVGSFADAGTHTAADFRAFVDWGDSAIPGASQATIRPAARTSGPAPHDGTVTQLYLITDSHNYDEAGTYPINVTIVADDGRTAHLTSVAQVSK